MGFGDKLRAAFVERSAQAVQDLYAQDALIDANVPTWRFQRKGHEEILRQLVEWSEEPMDILSVTEWETPWGSVVETEDRTKLHGEWGYSRMLHLLFAEDGKVTRHVVYCTGPWDDDTIARQKLEAPMYEP